MGERGGDPDIVGGARDTGGAFNTVGGIAVAESGTAVVHFDSHICQALCCSHPY